MTDEAISDSNGLVLARIEDILAVDRGAFAMKPSNGFTLKLKTKQPRGWAPGLWWRLGNRVGVGGATAAGQSKFMAEQIALRIAGRERYSTLPWLDLSLRQSSSKSALRNAETSQQSS